MALAAADRFLLSVEMTERGRGAVIPNECEGSRLWIPKIDHRRRRS